MKLGASKKGGKNTQSYGTVCGCTRSEYEVAPDDPVRLPSEENQRTVIMSDFDSTVNVKCLAPLGASDHAVILADLPICPYKEPNTSRVVWRYNQADWGRLRAFFRDFDWSSAITDSPEQSCTNITSTIQNGMQWFIPSRKLLSRPADPAWWTPECTEAASVKQHAWRRFDKLATEENRVNAKIATEACKSVLKTAEDARLRTLRNKLSTRNMSDRSWWSTVRQAGGGCRNSSIPTLKGQSGSEYTTNAQKAECFGEFFALKCSLGAADFPDNLPKENFPHVKPRTMDKLSTVHFRRVNVRKELRRLNTAKASGPDDIPAHVLKSCADELSHPLSKLFSLCFRKQIQPYQWKCAVPVYKKKSKSLPPELSPGVTPLYHLQGDGINRKPATAELSRVTWSSLPSSVRFQKGSQYH